MRWGPDSPLREVPRRLQGLSNINVKAETIQQRNVAHSLPEAALPRARRWLLRMAEDRREDEKAVLLLTEQQQTVCIRGPLGCLERHQHERVAAELHDHND